MKRLLVIDWDYFFKVSEPPAPGWPLYDWGHNENWAPAMQSSLWQRRAVAFLRNQIPLPGLSGLEQTFWNRFTFTTRTQLFVSESNFASMLPSVRRGITDVVLFDAHHDGGYKERLGNHWTCENWAIWYGLKGIPVQVYYPTWRADVFALEDYCLAESLALPFRRQFDQGHADVQPFDRIHVCRSGTWVPPWLDDAFEAFLTACPAYTTLQRIEPPTVTPRPFLLENVYDEIHNWEKLEALCQMASGR